MATPASPVYGKQFIRFAETAFVSETSDLKQFTVVSIDINVPPTEPPTVTYSGGGESMGVNQSDILAVDSDRAVTFPRLATIATSGLLLVQADDKAVPVQGAALTVTGGIATSSAGGSAVTINGTAPTVRQQVVIGGVSHVLVSFN
jgi:hypothetical protein